MKTLGKIKEPRNLSKRVKWLRDYYFQGNERKWNNEYKCFTTGKPWDFLFDELTYYIVPEVISFYQTFTSSSLQSAKKIDLPNNFWGLSLKERRATFLKEVVVNNMPMHIIQGDLLCGSNFNVLSSHCLNKKQGKDRSKLVYGKDGTRESFLDYYYRGFGNVGSTSGHLIPNYPKVLDVGFKGIYYEIEKELSSLSIEERTGSAGEQLRAMLIACEMPKEFAKKYSDICKDLAFKETNEIRKSELELMTKNLSVVPWNKPTDFYEAIQALWITHMLVMSDENYPGPGISFGRLDQYLYPFFKISKEKGMTIEFMKEILGCFWFHCNTVYDAQIKVGYNGITAGFGQLFNLSGRDKDGNDSSNELTYLLLDMIDDMSPILEPKPNVRLHKNSPDKLLDKVVQMIAESQGAPFLLNFDERSMAGMLREAKEAHVEDLINEDNVHEYASVGCLENTMCGNDRSGTVDNNLYLYKAVELAFNQGKALTEKYDESKMKPLKIVQMGPITKSINDMETFEEFYEDVKIQTAYMVEKSVIQYEKSEYVRSKYGNTPYLSTLVKGTIKSHKDVTEGGAELRFVTIEGVTFATTVDSLLAVKYLVFDKKVCDLETLKQALISNWDGHEKLRQIAKNKTPKYGRDDDEADTLAKDYMEFFSNETWKYKTKATNRQFRPGMLSWNYWVGAGFILPASPDGRRQGEFLSNAICPSNGADINGPTANSNSVGTVLGGKSENGDFEDYLNCLPNGASHTITFNSSMLSNINHLDKFKSFLRGYIENGGTALQINVLDSAMLKDAQKHPENYKNLLVRVTGYNAYFVTVGRELQNEIIAREMHRDY